MKRALSLFVLLVVISLGLPLYAYWIQHGTNAGVFDQAVNPEQFRPTESGLKPSPGDPPAAVHMELLPIPPGYDPAMINAISRSVETWNAVQGSAMRVSIELPDTGDTYNSNWRSRHEGTDGRNTIEFMVDDWPAFWGPLTIAVTIPKFDPATGKINEADMFLNARDFNWMILPDGRWPGLEDLNIVDVEALVTHEMGHVLGVGHSQHSWASMNVSVGLADTRARRLTNDDIMALKSLYPARDSDVPPPSIWKVAKGPFGDGVCGMTFLSFTSLPVFYDDSLEFSHPLPSGSDTYCLFGSGFNQDYLYDIDLAFGSTVIGATTAIEFISSNFVRVQLVNNSAGFPEVPAGSYDFSVLQVPGGDARLTNALVLNPVGNTAPMAVIQPDRYSTVPGGRIKLDGSGSIDADGDTVTFSWSVVESPPGSEAKLISGDSVMAEVRLPAEGIYVVGLIVTDGLCDSTPDQVTLRVVRPVSGSGGSSGGFSCTALGLASHGPSSWISLLIILGFPLLAVSFIRRRLRSTKCF